ncbi:TnsA-like heteromeric transposase endonuclease subunit [Streptomyces sp. NPDC005148]
MGIRSHDCTLDHLALAYEVRRAASGRLSLGDSWLRRWSATWQFDGDEVTLPLRDLAAAPFLSSQPVRRFAWRARQRHRPGLQYMVSTDRHHGFESLEEARLLLALDFVTVAEVLPQPFRLSFEHADGRAEHTPDFLAVMPDGGRWLLDVRPWRLVKESDELKFAAAQELASAAGWRYTVVSGWAPHVQGVLDQLSAQRRVLQDPLELQHELETAAAAGPIEFWRLVEATSLPAVARAHALHMLWHPRLGVELGLPLRARPWSGLLGRAEEAGEGDGSGRMMPLLDLAPGARLRLHGIHWTVEEITPQRGEVVLNGPEGRSEVRSIRWLMHHPDCRPVTPTRPVAPGETLRQPTTAMDLSEEQLNRARLPAAHVLEAVTGFRSGHATRALPGEPRPAYDPERTTVSERRRTKAAELAELGPDEAAMLGLANMSVRTLERLAARNTDDLVVACADGRWTRKSGGHPSITEEIREACFAVRQECLERSRISMRARHRLVHQYVRETFPDFPPEKIPSYFTLRNVWPEWFGPGGARQRYVRSAEAAKVASQR